ncbi:MAG: hypothetical protein DPW18_13915 [Chloroflexi bacterium]|nr:hypothetical protein [Chloroflexota bacterium]
MLKAPFHVWAHIPGAMKYMNKPMTFYSFNDPTHLYFVTASIVGWIHVFAQPEYAKIPLQSLEWMQKQGRILLFAFVIMPSHLHAILKPQKGTISEFFNNLVHLQRTRYSRKPRKSARKNG